MMFAINHCSRGQDVVRKSMSGNLNISRGIAAWITDSLIVTLATVPLLAGCTSARAETEVVWAVNVGGPGYKSTDGIAYEAETSVTGGSHGRMEDVKGSQDAFLYKSYREGDIEITHPIANGSYDITFYFAEPEVIERGDRVFDAFAEGKRVADDVDVMLFRDGKVFSALTVTTPNVVVMDGELNISFDASAGEPVLSALVVRDKHVPEETWELIWSDEFDNDGPPDPTKWNIEEWQRGYVNDEDQAYTARDKNLRIEDGNLIIEAFKEDYQDASYTSGRIQSSGKADFLYGRFEIRAKLPGGQGTWPAIWMLPSNPFTYATTCTNDKDWQSNDDCDAWPNSGEMDIMEHVGFQRNHIHGTVHTKANYWRMWEQRKGRILINDAADAYHVYALVWTPERIDTFVDDSLYFTYINENKGWQEWPFDQPFHLILNIAVGGAWGRAGGPIDDSIFPQRMLVDYARVYRRATAH